MWQLRRLKLAGRSTLRSRPCWAWERCGTRWCTQGSLSRPGSRWTDCTLGGCWGPKSTDPSLSSLSSSDATITSLNSCSLSRFERRCPPLQMLTATVVVCLCWVGLVAVLVQGKSLVRLEVCSLADFIVGQLIYLIRHCLLVFLMVRAHGSHQGFFAINCWGVAQNARNSSKVSGRVAPWRSKRSALFFIGELLRL